MSYSKYAVPTWITESMPEKAEELVALADKAALTAVADKLQILRSSVDGLDTAFSSAARKSAVAFCEAALAACREILMEIADAPATPLAAPSTTGSRVVSSRTFSDGTTSTLSPEAQENKRRSSAVWYYIRDHKADRYADPGDFKAKNPEEYRQMREAAVQLYNEGKLTASGKMI
jgi:hypothetical protein